MPDETRAPAPTWQPPPDSEQLGGDLDAAERHELPASAYAFPRQRKEPLSSASHVRSALSRFDQVADVSDADRAPPSRTSVSPRPTSMSRSPRSRGTI